MCVHCEVVAVGCCAVAMGQQQRFDVVGGNLAVGSGKDKYGVIRRCSVLVVVHQREVQNMMEHHQLQQPFPLLLP